MRSLLQPGFGMFSARAGRGRLGGEEKRFLINYLRTLCFWITTWALPLVAYGGEYVWIEGESPTAKNADIFAAQPSGRPEYMSGGQWLMMTVEDKDHAKIPADGAQLVYEFEPAKAGKHELWARLGLESVRSSFDWRLDEGEWKAVPALTYPYTDLMDPAIWNEVSWVKMGDADLAAGKHKLQIRISPAILEEKKQVEGKDVVEKKPQRTIFCVDCFCISPGRFLPNGKHQPGAEWMSDKDKDAAAKVYEMPAAQAQAVPAGARGELSLAGPWQVARFDEWDAADRTGPDKTLPKAEDCFWSAIPVPGNKYEVRPDLNLCHRLIYRVRAKIPAEAKGRGFFLHIPAFNMIASVHVNGTFCGWSKGMLAAWDCDITPAVKPGEVNEIWVVIKDTYYGMSPQKSKQPWHRTAFTPASWLQQSWVMPFLDFPVAGNPEAGLIESAPSLVVCGGVYAADVFAVPLVQKKQLTLEVTLRNPGPAEATVKVEAAIEPLAGGAAEKTMTAREVKLSAGQEAIVKLTDAWENPKLWWPDDPQQYVAVTSVSVGGKVVDLRRTKFGFREWEWDSSQFRLNGIPWHFRADTTSAATPEESLKIWREHGQNMMRFWGRSLYGATVAGESRKSLNETLDFLDASGIAVRRSGIFDGQGAQYSHRLADPALFDNWTVQLLAWVKEERNHPSILIWSIENEITFINSRNLGLSQAVEPLVGKAGKAVMAFDPTRPVMVDGGRCLITEELPVNGCHYDETHWREYPDEAYTFALAEKSHEKGANWNLWGASPWRLVPNRPIFNGESFYLRGERPAAFAQFGGEGCFVGWSACRPGAGLFAKMLSEGYRWHETAAFHFWLDEASVSNYYNSWKDVAVLCREWNWTFAGGTAVERTLKILNDTRVMEPIEMAWEFKVGDKQAGGEKKPYAVAPGTGLVVKISLPVPAVKERTKGELVLTCSRGGKELFRDVKEVWVIDSEAGPKPALKAEELAVLDPNGAVKARLGKRGVAFTELKPGAEIPAAVRVVVVGPDALDSREATDTKWKSVAARGGRVLVLDQANPLRFAAIPADLEATLFVGRVAISENLNHPVFQGLDQPDFFTWSKDHVVYRNVYRKATRGAKSLAHCDQDLGYTCLTECEVNDGLLIACQMLVGTKLATDPVAQRLFDNMLAYATTYQSARKATAVVFDEKTPRGKLLAESGLMYEKAADPLAAIQGGKAQIVVLDAVPENLKALAGNMEAIRAFTQKGGWLFLWGLTPEGLADFNKVVGVEHLIRPFIRERVTLPAQRDPILSGLTLRDVVMESGQQIAFYAGRYMASDVFSYVVDFDDAAPFLKMPDWKQFTPGKDQPDPDKVPHNLVNGFTSGDDWRYIFQIPIKPEFLEWDMELPREETPTEITLIPNAFYKLLNKIQLTYDGDDKNPITLDVKPQGIEQAFPLPERKAKKIHLKIVSWEEKQTANCVGIDNLWLKVKRPADFFQKVKPLLNIGALVKYPQGQGGVILCQLNVPEQEQLPENAQKKKTVVSTLLRNAGAVFSGGKMVVAGANLVYEPVPMNETCNQYLTKDKGWFGDEPRDLSHFPVGEQKLAGVTYLVRDFKTSTLPVAIALAGPSLKDKPMEVKDIKVGKRTDALFFLHAWKQTGQWQLPGKGDKTPPVVWKYVIHYTDGQIAEALVRYGEGAGNWVQKAPAGLPNAVVAWATAFPGDNSGDQAVVYQMQWTNPRPDVEIATIDVAYDPTVKNQFGVPVVLAITAAREAK